MAAKRARRNAETYDQARRRPTREGDGEVSDEVEELWWTGAAASADSRKHLLRRRADPGKTGVDTGTRTCVPCESQNPS